MAVASSARETNLPLSIRSDVAIQIGDRQIRGRAEALDEDGALLLRSDHGHLERIIGGDVTTRVIARAIGPSLVSHGITNALSDTTLDLHDGNGTLMASNDDWQSTQAAEIIASGVPPTNLRESAIVRTLPPGSFTAIVRGKDGTTGVGLVEVYNLESN